MKKINVYSTILCTILLLVFAMIFVGCDFSNAGVNNSTPDMDQNDNNDCTHPSTEWKIDKEATCTTTGSKHKECSTCGETLATESISSLGHYYDEIIIPPTEEQQGYTLHQCSRCEDNYKDNFVDYEYTEAEYKQMFETNLLAAIQKEYNNDTRSEKFYLQDLQNIFINYATGEISFICMQNGEEFYVETTSEEITKHQTYKALYDNLQTEGFELEFSSRQTNEDLAKEIVEFALSQPAVQAFVEENNLDLENLKILNVEEFDDDAETFNSVTKITLILEDKIFSFEVGGPTGYKSTEEGYLNRLKELVETDDVCVEDFVIKPYADLDVES